jgi:YtoQ family protein
MNDKVWKIYLSGEIHSDWREQIENGCAEVGLPVSFAAPITEHDDSDDCGVAVFGSEPDKFWHDHKGAMLNSVRTSTLIGQADVVVVRFGEKYKQWNAAFDAGYAAALGKPLITLHPPEHDHALKEVDAVARGVAREPFQVVQALAYAINGGMPGQWYKAEAAE